MRPYDAGGVRPFGSASALDHIRRKYKLTPALMEGIIVSMSARRFLSSISISRCATVPADRKSRQKMEKMEKMDAERRPRLRGASVPGIRPVSESHVAIFRVSLWGPFRGEKAGLKTAETVKTVALVARGAAFAKEDGGRRTDD